jgi:hypothetical protein
MEGCWIKKKRLEVLEIRSLYPETPLALSHVVLPGKNAFPAT